MPWSRIAADVVLVAHRTYVLFVVVGQLAILVGLLRGARWARNPWFRGVHLTMIGIVVVEAWIGMTCPLTTLENWLRAQGGGAGYDGDFLAIWLHDLLFIDAPPWMFTLAYSTFGVVVIATFVLAPPRFRRAPAASGANLGGTP